MTKIAEGGFNRVFLLAFDDKLEVIAKISFTLSAPHHYASEAATLSFLNKRGFPFPKVYAWNSTKVRNPVGVEYIIMSKAAGIGLDTKWFDLTYKEQVQVVIGYAEVEKKIFDLPFASIGSIYFKDSLPPDLQAADSIERELKTLTMMLKPSALGRLRITCFLWDGEQISKSTAAHVSSDLIIFQLLEICVTAGVRD